MEQEGDEMAEPRIVHGETSVVLYDAAHLSGVPESWFEESYWRDRDAVLRTVSGRGSVFVVDKQPDIWVLRHYRRGGLVARFIDDHYLWLGTERTRAFREWRLLASLLEEGLPVPQPIAARVCRSGPVYQADIITAHLTDTRSLASLLSENFVVGVVWENIGMTLRTFHNRGVDHADLTAHNILLDSHDRVFLVDFDRGAFRRPGRWCQGNLDRFKRSLLKVALETGSSVDESGWRVLERAYGVR